MSPGVLSCVIFALTLGGIVLGALLRTTLPQHHLSKDSQDVVRLGVGLIATIAALVLGLLIAAAKGSFDTQSGQVKQITADTILLDALLEQYGPEAQPIRVEMRSVIGPLADRLWHEKAADAARPFARDAKTESAYIAIQALSPRNDLQRSLQSRAAQISTDLAQTRLLLFAESDSAIPAPFIAILAFWLIIIFASFSLFAALNVTVFAFLSSFALSASCAIFLILELSQPFTGLLMIPSAPLRNALAPLG
ncbi:MAG TPA: hypothetical protein VN362_21770 [Xanthobacteraceae bacterium]|jgi:hypothetical protein|nr:hypothetical protein [Xanthobacteraceae bacterium]